MRIATRLWLALLATIVLVLGADVFIRVRQEQQLLLEVTLRDRTFFARALQAAFSREHGSVDPLGEVRALLAREEIAEAHIVARLVSLDPRSDATPRLPPAHVAPLTRGEVVVGVYGDELLTYVPLEVPAHVTLELAEPHTVGSLLAGIGFQSLIFQACSLAFLAGLVTFVLVRWLVGVPLGRLSLLARQIGAGELSARAHVPHGRHEVAVLAREMNGMAETLQKAQRALEETNTERVAALEQLRHADRLRTVGQIASVLAHEIGTPLNVVSGHARLIEQEPRVPDEARASARAVIEQASRIMRIVKDLLGFARRSSSQLSVHALVSVAEHAARTLEPLARRQHVSIRVEGPASVSARVDAQQLLQVLTNLLMNALHAMPQGGDVIVRVDELDTSSPTGVHAPAGHYARISVTDAGAGIDPEDLPHLFEPFFTRRSEGEGTGLGLAVVEGIVKEHHGWVSVFTERGRGSCFEVFLPLANGVVASAERSSAADCPDEKPR